jgi:phage-related protein
MKTDQPHKTPVIFYQTPAGRDVVLDWIRSLTNADRAIVGQDLMRVQFRWPVGMPLCRSLGEGLWEVRSDLSGSRISRLLFCVIDGRIVVLGGFIKKTRKTPDEILNLARRRKREFER